MLVQDYHLTLVPRMLRDRRPDLRDRHFSHTPWAPPDYFRDAARRRRPARSSTACSAPTTPASSPARWAEAFLDCCEAVLGAEVDRAGRGRFSHGGHTTTVGVHPLGVDAGALRERAAAADVAGAVARAGVGRRATAS